MQLGGSSSSLFLVGPTKVKDHKSFLLIEGSLKVENKLNEGQCPKAKYANRQQLAERGLCPIVKVRAIPTQYMREAMPQK